MYKSIFDIHFFSLHPFIREYLVYCSVVQHTHTPPHPLGPSVHHSLISEKKSHPSPHPIRGQLYYNLEMHLRESRPAARHGSQCWLCHSWQRNTCCLHPYIPASLQHQIPMTPLVLICEAYTVIHLWCYGYGGRFMTQNKLLRSCMWWGNQERKWAGNSLLHATLIHPSVRETSPLCAPHRKGP